MLSLDIKTVVVFPVKGGFLKMSKAVLKATAIEKISIPNYKILELIGTGGMANIYKAIQLSLDRPVALKIMHQHLSMDEGFVARFEKEAKQAAQLHQENIVSIIDYGQGNSDYYIAMEYVDGTNLKEIMEKQKRLPLEICLLICHQVAEGMKFAHSHNIVHRDIKPANIILSNDGRVMITDFGIAKGGDDLTITTTGQMIGSPAYMSPEQAAGKHVDHRSDIFSLGIILYEVIAGEKPFRGDTYQSMVASIMSHQPESLQKLRVDVNPEIEALVEKAIVKDPPSRFQNAEEFADRIYAQLERFKLPPIKKLISSFLKNPIKVTEKLRTEKISNHMESALYYLTLGEGRLKDARKEFQEVLRYDKNNKSAKEYLNRLTDRATLAESRVKTGGNRLKISSRHALAGIFALAILVIAIFIIPGGDAPGPIDDNQLKAGSEMQDDADVNAKEDGVSGDIGGRSTGDSHDNVRSVDSNVDKINTPAKPAARETKKKQVARRRKSTYNYPNQNLKEYGLLTVKTNVPAEIYVDLEKYGATNGSSIRLAPGRHFIEIRADGYRKMTRRIFSDKDKTIDLRIDLLPER